MVTITGVDVTPDYAHATVRFSLLVGDTAECETALNEAAGFVRNGLFKRLRSTPCRPCTSSSIAPPNARPS